MDLVGLHRIRGKLRATVGQAAPLAKALAEAPGERDAAALRGHLRALAQALEVRECYAASLLVDEMIVLATLMARPDAERRREAGEILTAGIDRLRQALLSVSGEPAVIPEPPITLLNDARAVRGAPLISENVLFAAAISARPPPAAEASVDAAEVAALAGKLRPHYQRGLVLWLRGDASREGLDLLGGVMAHLVKATRGHAQAPLWRAAAGFCRGLAGAGAAPAPKRLLGQLDREIKRLSDRGADALGGPVPPALLCNLLFHVAVAARQDGLTRTLCAQYALEECFGIAGVSPERRAATLDEVSATIDGVADLLDADADPDGALTVPALQRCADSLALLQLGMPRKLVLEQLEALADGAAAPGVAAPLRRIARSWHTALGTRRDPPPDVDPSRGAEPLMPDLSHVQEVLRRMEHEASGVSVPAPLEPDGVWVAHAVAPLGVSAGDGATAGGESELAALARSVQDALSVPVPAVVEENDWPDGAAGLAADGIPVDGDLLENLATVVGEMGNARVAMESRVGSLRDGLQSMQANIAGLRRELNAFGEPDRGGADSEREPGGTPGRPIGGLTGDALAGFNDRLERLSDGLQGLAGIQDTCATLTDETEALLARQARDGVELQQGLMRTRMLPLSAELTDWQLAADAESGVGGRRLGVSLEGGELQVDQALLSSLSPVVREVLREFAKCEAGAGPFATGASVRIIAARRGAAMVLELVAGFVAPERLALSRADAAIAQLGGALQRVPDGDSGARVRLTVPLRAPLTRVLRIDAEGERLALPLGDVEGVMRLDKSHLDGLAGQPPILEHNGRAYLFAHLATRLGLTGSGEARGVGVGDSVVLVNRDGQRQALAVEAIEERQDVIARPLGPPLSEVPWLVGACIIGADRPVLILEVAALPPARKAS